MKRLGWSVSLFMVLCAGCTNDAAAPGENGTSGADGQPAASSDAAAQGDANDQERSSGGGDATDAGSTDEDSGPILRAPDNAPAENAPDGNGAAATAPAADQVRILDWDETLALVKQHPGKVVVVDLWSHNCLPCLRELPHFAELCRKYPDQVTGIAFNMDYTGLQKEPPESFRDDVAETLGRHDADLIGVVSSVADTELWDQIDLSSVPAVYVFDQTGKEIKRFDNDNAETEFTYENDVTPLVESLLQETAAE